MDEINIYIGLKKKGNNYNITFFITNLFSRIYFLRSLCQQLHVFVICQSNHLLKSLAFEQTFAKRISCEIYTPYERGGAGRGISTSKNGKLTISKIKSSRLSNIY